MSTPSLAPQAEPVTLVTHGYDYARHDGIVTYVAIDPATGALPPMLACTGPKPEDLRAIYAAEPPYLGPGVLLDREPRTPAEHENPKTRWRYVQRPASAQVRCHHCGKGAEPDGDHRCPCPNPDSICPDHPKASQ